jgi:hypothetical protein
VSGILKAIEIYDNFPDQIHAQPLPEWIEPLKTWIRETNDRPGT